MNGQELMEEQMKAYRSMEESKKTAREKDVECAEYTKQYDIALAQKMLTLRAEGTLGSMVEKVAKGDPEVAELKFKAAVAEAEAKAARENINIKKRIYDSIEATMKRELG